MKVIWHKLFYPVMFTMIVLSSCVEDLDMSTDQMVEKTIPLSFEFSGIVTLGGETKATVDLTDDESRIHKGVLLQFDSNGNLLKKYDLDADVNTYKVRLFVPLTGKLPCVFVANASMEDMGLEGDKTITMEDLNTLSKSIASEKELIVDAEHGLLMSGGSDIDTNTKTLTFTLTPNVAKLKFTVSNGGTDAVDHLLKINSVQIRNVHNRILFAHHALDGAVTSNYSSVNSSTSFDYDLITFIKPLEPFDEAESREWYVPHNMSGDLGKTEDPDLRFATYVEVRGVRSKDYKTVLYKIEFHPETRNEATHNYNVQAGYRYTVDVTIRTEGDDSNSSFVPEETTIDFESSNCYFVNPSTSGIGSVYSFPITKIHDYWDVFSGSDKGDNGISEGTEWKAEVIWQDISSRTIRFCTPSGTNIGSDGNEFIGSGPDQRVYFKLENEINRGNVVIGIRKKDGSGNYEEKYQWSWHLWITDYNPNSEKIPDPAWEGTYPGHVWNVTGGEVHRYDDFSALNGVGVWSNEYKDSYIMDRNLGETYNKFAANGADAGTLYYQYGRKDPFPGAVQMYDITGNRIDRFFGKEDYRINNQMVDFSGHTVSLGVVTQNKLDHNPKYNVSGLTSTQAYHASLQAAIHYPFVFYKGDLNNGYFSNPPHEPNYDDDWLITNNYPASNWNYPGDREMKDKSLFDPCPLGWKVCRIGTFHVFSNSFDDNNHLYNPVYDAYYRANTTSANMNVKEPLVYNSSLGYIRSIDNGLHFYIANKEEGKGDPPTAYFFLNGHRRSFDGSFHYNIAVWAIDGAFVEHENGNPGNAYHLVTDGAHMAFPDLCSRSFAIPVRCVRE